jgi:hypothetical protein
MLKKQLDVLSMSNHSSALVYQCKADLVHRLAQSWVLEGDKHSAQSFWKAVIETLNRVEQLDPSLVDQVNHARAIIISSVYLAKVKLDHDTSDLPVVQESIREALDSDLILETVFKPKLVEGQVTFESLWPGFSRRFD